MSGFRNRVRKIKLKIINRPMVAIVEVKEIDGKLKRMDNDVG